MFKPKKVEYHSPFRKTDENGEGLHLHPTRNERKACRGRNARSRHAIDARSLSGQQIVHDFTVHIRKAKITATVAERQKLMIEPQQMEHGRVQIVEMNLVLH